MATLALSLAGQVVGGAVGGPLGAVVGRALGALAGSVIDSALFADKSQPKGADIHLQGSSEGAPIPRLYGWSRMSGNIIWATDLERLDDVSAGIKGGGGGEQTDEIAASFALGLCEGEVHRLGRIWADGEVLDTSGLTIRFYRGTETQLPDSLIAAKQADAPAYRGLCYLVFERLPLSRFGNRIPVLSVELCRVVGELEPLIEAVTVIPGATEFGYDPVARVRLLGGGVTVSENAHQASGVSDWSLSIDELVALCPNLEHVSLVVAWFGNDLRAATCSIAPRVEAASRTVKGVSWQVGSVTRAAATPVSTHDGGPAYGGTPSDAAVLASIADLKARGLKVTLYPIVLMDIPEGNALGQPAYPWRGRIAISAGAVGTSAAATEAAAFAAQYRAMILHYANLAVSAGGVDTFLLGSEMRGMTGARGAANSFPFVNALVSLAAEVRGIIGGTPTLTYGADWTEYSGVQSGGEKFFHLDPLWASAHISAVGIDCYMPLSDWRDGGGPDAADWDGPYDPAYLTANIAGGEGYDWYYVSDAARADGTRTPITDGAYGEPWVWRNKDLVGWWSNTHRDRPGGVRNTTTTDWVPRSKPIVLTEVGCGAVDKGANQPNVFSDSKSAESGVPYFSNGVPDALMQRQALRTILAYWADPAHNVSDGAGGQMIKRITCWTWDARPFPSFPRLSKVWADGANHATGHWLNGRLGCLASDELIAAIADDCGVTLDQLAAAQPFVTGQLVPGPASARTAMAPILDASGLTVRDTADGLVVGMAVARTATVLGELADEEGPLLTRRRPDSGEAVGAVTLAYVERERDYQAGAVTALATGAGILEPVSTELVLDLGNAQRVAAHLLQERLDRDETVSFALPPSAIALEVGDAVTLAGRVYEITTIRDTASRRVEARRLAETVPTITTVVRAAATGGGAKAASEPELVYAHLPPSPETPTVSRLVIGAYADPWPGDITIANAATGTVLGKLERPATIGALTASLAAGPIFMWDDLHAIDLTLSGGHLSSRDDDDVLAGANRIAVETDAGEWEILGFANAALLAPSSYRLTRLLRGQGGSDAAIGTCSIGRQVLVLNGATVSLAVPGSWLDGGTSLTAFAGSADATGTTTDLSLTTVPVLPLAPTALAGFRDSGGDVTLSWLRRSRADAGPWSTDHALLDYVPEGYKVTIYNGASLVRTIVTSLPSATYAAAQQTADFGTLPSSFGFTVAQTSLTYGAGPGATAIFTALG